MQAKRVVMPNDKPKFLKRTQARNKLCCCSRHCKYTLEPLRTDGQASLVCADMEAIQEIHLTEMQFYWGGPFGEIEIRKSKNCLASMKARNKGIPDNANLSSAIFSFRLAGMKQHRTVQIRPPSLAVYEREADKEYVEPWLRKRGFLIAAGNHAEQPQQTMEDM